MALTVAVSTVGKFVVGTQYATGSQALSVYPPGFIKSICGAAVCGDGHVCLGVPSGQFGTVNATVSLAQSKAVTGLASAQSFGTVTAKAVFLRSVTGLGSAQSFGTIRVNVKAPSGGVSSAQQFGVPAIKTAVTRTVSGIASAQAFGTATAKSVFVRSVNGLGSPQAFGAPTTKTTVTRTLSGLGSGQAFGTLIVAPGAVTRTVSGLASAQAFGPVRAIVPVRPGSVPSAQAFGVIHVTVNQIVPVQGVLPYGPQINSICGEPICGDGHLCGYRGGPLSQFGQPTIKTGPVTQTVAGVQSAQAFGTPDVFVVWTRPLPCTDLDLEFAACLNPGAAVLNTFLCGQQTVSAGNAIVPLPCLSSPGPEICGEPICGDGSVCGGYSYVAIGECLDSPNLSIVGTFICGQRYAHGYGYLSPEVPPLVLDLVPAGCA